jgi:iron complex transport system substrate-binding protein
VSITALPDGLDDPAEIDRVVHDRISAGEDLYHLDRGALADIDADLVVTQNLCAVCAVDVSTVHDALDYLACRAEVLTTDPHTLDEVLASVVTVGEAVGLRASAEKVVARLRERLAAIRVTVGGRAPVRALVLEWTDPPFAPGHWVPDMVEAAGGRSVLGRSGEDSFRTSWADVAAAAPDVVISAPCGFSLDESVRLARDLVRSGALPDGPPLWAVDANASFARPGPRLVDGVEALVGIFHPDVTGGVDPALAQRIR